MKQLVIILTVLTLFACEKVTIKPDSSVPQPYAKIYTTDPILTVSVTFDPNCQYPVQREGCEGDWNKLIYFGSVNPHHNGAAFVWRATGDDRHLEIGYYLWLDGIKPTISGRMGVIQTIQTGQTYTLSIDTRNGIKWSVNGSVVHTEHDQIKANWITSGWFGGADDNGCDCNATQEITYTLKIIRQ